MLNVPEYLGHILVNGNEMYALGASDLFFRWNPEAENATLFRVHHPLPNIDIDVSPAAQFGGFSPAMTPHGVVAADDTTHRFLTLLIGPSQQRWHLDSDYSLGVPAVADGTIYTGMGGQAACNSITAIDSASGETVWTFAPKRLISDRQKPVKVFSPKTVYTPESVEPVPGAASPRGLTRVRVTSVKTNIVPVPVLQPQSVEPYAHWKNAGLVIAKDRIYAEVGHSIVALARKDGSVEWTIEMPEGSAVRSIVGTAKHLVYCVSNKQETGKRRPVWAVKAPEKETYLVAVDLKEGKEVWRQQVQLPGNLAVAHGNLYFTDGSLRVFGPGYRASESTAGAR
jgi:outer membrane protein assembly factor BamB